MALEIHNAILHVLNNDGGASYLSSQELDIDSETCEEFVTKHIKKLMNNPSAKEATFQAESKALAVLRELMEGKIFFKDASKQLCGMLSDIMQTNVEIPSADVLITRFENKGEMYFAILKLNYKECFTHQVNQDDTGADNQIVKYRAVLPFDGGKVEEACLIPYEPMVLRILEKPYPVNGEDVNYFSQLFLECDTELSKKEAVKIIQEVTEEINEKFYNGSIETEAKFKAALIEEAQEEDGVLDLEKVAAKVFGEVEEVKKEYISMAREAGIHSDLPLGEKILKQQFGTQRFKADNGIEVKFPSGLIEDDEVIELKNNADGSITIMLKHLHRAE